MPHPDFGSIRSAKEKINRGKKKKKSSESGRGDLNSRPLGPEPSALARLRYAPK